MFRQSVIQLRNPLPFSATLLHKLQTYHNHKTRNKMMVVITPMIKAMEKLVQFRPKLRSSTFYFAFALFTSFGCFVDTIHMSQKIFEMFVWFFTIWTSTAFVMAFVSVFLRFFQKQRQKIHYFTIFLNCVINLDQLWLIGVTF